MYAHAPDAAVRAARHSQLIVCLLIAAFTLTVLSACTDHGEEAPTLPSTYLAMRKSALVHAPYHAANPFDSIGIRHNQIVHAFVAATVPWDTLDVSHLLGRSQSAVTSWAMEHGGCTHDEGMGLVQSAFALRIDSTARRRLAAYVSAGVTPREQDYLRRLGEVLCTEDTFTDTQRRLDKLERDILTERWPAGDSTEVLPRLAIAIARHSYAYWKRMMQEVTPLPAADGALSKTAVDVIIRTNSKAKIIVAADVIAGTSAAEAAAGAGLLTQIKVGLISAGAVSAAVAIIVYFDEVVSFLNSLLPWNW